MSVTTTLSKNQLAFRPVLSCSILEGRGGEERGAGEDGRDDGKREEKRRGWRI